MPEAEKTKILLRKEKKSRRPRTERVAESVTRDEAGDPDHGGLCVAGI